MFWWASSETRKKILHRFAVTRNVLQNSCQDLFPKAAGEGWSDPGVRKALQFIERRQRNRAARERSEFETLEQAIEAAATGAQILTDKTGEAIAILCKAPGMKRHYIEKLWRALKRPVYDSTGDIHPDLARVKQTYDVISTDKAQTVLRRRSWGRSDHSCACLWAQ